MKKFSAALYVLVMAVLTFATLHSSCGGSDNVVPVDTTSSQAKRMTITSPAFRRNGSYSVYRGKNVSVIGTTAKYYVTPENHGTENITLNLEYSSAISEDLPIVITDSDDQTVIFSYIPSNTGSETDTTSTGVYRYGGLYDKLTYTSLTLSTASVSEASVELDDSEGIIDIVLNSDGTATAAGASVPVYNYVWHADPQHPEEYWTLGDSTEVIYGDQYENIIADYAPANGIYIARDIRYTSNTLEFTTSQTATKDEDTEYVVYYDLTASAMQEALADLSNDYGAEYGTAKYIFATLPMSNGMGGGTPPDGGNGGTPPDGGTPPSGNPPSAPAGFSASATDTSAIPSFSTMTHSASEAYANPVLHITEAGTYRISGKWHGQIWIEVGKKAQHQVGLILNGVEVSCDVAPALVFYEVYKWAEEEGYASKDVLAADDLWKTLGTKMTDDSGYYDLGAIVEIADGTTNSFTGANVYRILELCPKTNDDTGELYSASEIGRNISAQKKMYKLDGAFHSRRSIVIGGGSAGTGKLNVTSTTCEGLDSEMHMLISGGDITVTAPDDGINVNEDYVSVFEMDSGTLTITSSGGDGIDSNGWISIQGGTLDITAGNQRINSNGEAGLDAENGYDIYDDSAYTWTAYSGSSNPGDDSSTGGGDSTGGDDSGTTDNDNTNSNGTATILEVKETTVNIGGTKFTLFPETLLTDTEGERNIPVIGDTFPLVHRVNDFGGLVY